MSEKSAPDSLQLWSTVVHAGFPSPGEEYAEPPLHLHDLLVQHALATYFLRVKGSSMRGAGIFAGDVIVVDRALTPENNQIVVVRVNEHLALKRVQIQEQRTLLLSDPPDGNLLFLEEGPDIEIWGVVSYAIHHLL